MAHDCVRAAMEACAARGITGARWAVLVAVAQHADRDGVAWPSIRTVARLTARCVGDVSRALVALRRAGELVVVRDGGGSRGDGPSRRGRSTVYVVRGGRSDDDLRAVLARAACAPALAYRGRGTYAPARRYRGGGTCAPDGGTCAPDASTCAPARYDLSSPDPSRPDPSGGRAARARRRATDDPHGVETAPPVDGRPVPGRCAGGSSIDAGRESDTPRAAARRVGPTVPASDDGAAGPPPEPPRHAAIVGAPDPDAPPPPDAATAAELARLDAAVRAAQATHDPRDRWDAVAAAVRARDAWLRARPDVRAWVAHHDARREAAEHADRTAAIDARATAHAARTARVAELVARARDECAVDEAFGAELAAAASASDARAAQLAECVAAVPRDAANPAGYLRRVAESRGLLPRRVAAVTS